MELEVVVVVGEVGDDPHAAAMTVLAAPRSPSASRLLYLRFMERIPP